MKMYRDLKGAFHRTKVEGDKANKALGADFAEQVDVPTNQQELVEYLNNLRQEVMADAPKVEVSTPSPTLVELPEQRTGTPAQQRMWSAHSVVEWVMDGASPAECERLFEALGTRFSEAVKGER